MLYTKELNFRVGRTGNSALTTHFLRNIILFEFLVFNLAREIKKLNFRKFLTVDVLLEPFFSSIDGLIL